MSKKIKVTEVAEYERSPSNYYVVNATGNYVFFHTRDRKEAKAAADEMYGKNFYTIRTTDQSPKTKTKRQLLSDIDAQPKQEEEA